jgi:hypothetical protein
MAFQNFFPGIVITNTTLWPNIESLFAFQNLFQKKKSTDCNILELYSNTILCMKYVD